MRTISRLTTKGQITIPKAVRAALRLAEGDIVAFELGDNAATMRRVQTRPVSGDVEALDAQLAEWGGGADAEAYRDL
ncbi:MAG: AbrB/MazE/SpoVT family DNA-binding domain-containing protein [Rhodospirillales bacterium]|nr:MAG: AbrB/MazE/SpoVT family DNA-binding domain-containing protein [Rhodospirillales bacterium]